MADATKAEISALLTAIGRYMANDQSAAQRREQTKKIVDEKVEELRPILEELCSTREDITADMHTQFKSDLSKGFLRPDEKSTFAENKRKGAGMTKEQKIYNKAITDKINGLWKKILKGIYGVPEKLINPADGDDIDIDAPAPAPAPAAPASPAPAAPVAVEATPAKSLKRDLELDDFVDLIKEGAIEVMKTDDVISYKRVKVEDFKWSQFRAIFADDE